MINMKKVTDLSSTEYIHCKTQEQWNKILALDPFNTRIYSDNWLDYGCNSVYYPKKSTYSHMYYVQESGYIIYPASDFLEPEFEWGEEIEVSYDGEMWYKKYFVGLNPKCTTNKYITVRDVGDVGKYQYARKIQQAKPIPEYTMEQLMDKVGHEFKIKK